MKLREFDIQHWIAVSAECDLPAAITLHPSANLEQQSHVSIDREAWRDTATEWKLRKKKILSPKRVLNCYCSIFVCTEVDIPTELSGMPHVSLLLMLILYLRLISVVCALYKRLRLFSRFRCNCTHR